MNQGFQDSSDACIWLAFKRGSESAYTQIYQSLANSLFNYGCKLTKDRDLVKDCIQEVFINLWRSKEKVADPTSIKAYLFKALRYEIARKLHPRLSLSDLPPDYHLEMELSPELYLIRDQSLAEQQEKLLQEIEKLPARQKEAIFLRYFDNLSFDEIALIMGVEQRSVYKLVYKAIDALQLGMVKVNVLVLLGLFSQRVIT